MSFEKLISVKTRARLNKLRTELNRLVQLPNQELAAELCTLLADARGELPAAQPNQPVYESSFLWHVLPEVIARLSNDQPQQPTGLSTLSNQSFRHMAGQCLMNLSRYSNGWAWALLTNEACNGNPVVMALDRICPGDLADPGDIITCRIKEIARIRGTAYTGVWTPAVLVG